MATPLYNILMSEGLCVYRRFINCVISVGDNLNEPKGSVHYGKGTLNCYLSY